MTRPDDGQRSELVARPPAAGPPDLCTQLEDILHCVWRAEADWRLSDRIDLSVRLDGRRRCDVEPGS